ncbi:type II toxin-antitoxin system HicB family antitoxin [bacterium]|nr:MAG: type II toxin-antitoxin system HicB family antitoxin [bacterium]
MANEISVNAVIIENEDGTYRALCPDLSVESVGKNSDDALRNLKDAVTKHVKEKGASLNSVKCMKLRVQVN